MKTLMPKLLSLDFAIPQWPTAKDALFREDSDWRHNAHLTLGGKSWGSYASGYKQAADFLAHRFLEDYQGMDVLTYPMVFLYRHYIELRLKQLIIAAQSSLEQPTDFKDKHDLVVLWIPCREILKEIWPQEPAATWNNAERLIKEFNKIDPEGANFRYPVTRKDKKGVVKNRRQTLPTLSCVGVRNLHEVIQRLASFFECHLDGISVQ